MPCRSIGGWIAVRMNVRPRVHRTRGRRWWACAGPEMLEPRCLLSGGDLTATMTGGGASSTDTHRPSEAEFTSCTDTDHHAKDTRLKTAPSSPVATGTLASTIAADAANPSSGTWTVMFYANGDNLNPDIYQNIVELEQIATLAPSSVRIVVLYSQPTYLPPNPRKTPVIPTGGGAQIWQKPVTTGTGLIQSRPEGTAPNAVYTTFTLGTSNVGDPRTLENFIVTTEQNYPAQNYALIMADHGGGVKGLNFDQNFVRLDPKNAHLTVKKLVGALAGAEQSGSRLDLLAIDECLMASTEVEYAVRNLVPYVVASEELISGAGNNYVNGLKPLTQDPGAVTPAQLGSALVASFYAEYKMQSTNNDTLSVVQTNGLDLLAKDLRAFVDDTATASRADWTGLRRARSDALKFGGKDPSSPFRDLGQFLMGVSEYDASPKLRADAGTALQALGQVVVAKTQDRRQATGLSIVLPTPGQRVPDDYANQASSFLTATGWLEFLKRFATEGRGAFCPDPVDWAESNNTANTATDLGIVQGRKVLVPDLTLPRGDVDWYEFATDAEGGPGDTIKLVGSPRDSNVTTKLFQGTATSMTLVASGRTTVSLNGSDPGNYLLEIMHPGEKLSFPYSVTINAPVPEKPADVPGGNSSLETATDLGTVIDPGLAVVSSGNPHIRFAVLNRTDPSEPAWYQFETPRSITPLDGALEVLGGTARNRRVTLYDQEGKAIASYRGRETVRVPFVARGDGESYSVSIGGGPGTYELYFTGLS